MAEEAFKYVEKKRSLFFGLPLSVTTYKIGEEYLIRTQGLLSKQEDNNYMYKITDVRLKQRLFERLLGLGTVQCIGGDALTPVLELQHIKKAREIKDYIFKQSEVERMKRKTVNMQDIDGPHMHLGDIPGQVQANDFEDGLHHMTEEPPMPPMPPTPPTE